MSIKALIPSVVVISFLSLQMSVKALIPSVVVISFLSLQMSVKALIPSVGGYKFPLRSFLGL